MTRQCAWCRKCLGQVAPLDDCRLTHGICIACGRRMLQSAGVHELPPLFGPRDQAEAQACNSDVRGLR